MGISDLPGIENKYSESNTEIIYFCVKFKKPDS
jgi:hypothetical protein